jgi:hypothetical protein
MPAGLTHGLGPWLLAAFGLAFVIAFIATIRSVRESRFSPYYLLRRQAAERMRTRFGLLLAVFVALLVLAVVLSLRPPIEVQLPALPFLPTPLSPTTPPRATLALPAPTATGTPTSTPTLVAPPTRMVATPSPPTPTRSLPAGVLTPLRPQVTAQPGAGFGPITIAGRVNLDTGRPLVVTDTFRTGHIPVYAVFTYTHMAPGMVWTHVWLRNDQIADADMEWWTLTTTGRAYITLNPPEGLMPGDYTVILFIEDRFQREAKFQVLP